MNNAVLNPPTSDVPLYSLTPSAPSAQISNPEMGPSAMRSTMEYAQPHPTRPQQEIAYKTPFGEVSVPIQCPVCQQQTISKIKHVSGNYTFVWAAGLCATLCLGCIPFCVGRLKNIEHTCSNCNTKLATWHRHDRRVDLHVWTSK